VSERIFSKSLREEKIRGEETPKVKVSLRLLSSKGSVLGGVLGACLPPVYLNKEGWMNGK